jgi:arginine decarboxylase-like protein
MRLTVRHADDQTMKEDMVRIRRSHRNGIESGKICKLTSLNCESDGDITHYVEVKGIAASWLRGTYMSIHKNFRGLCLCFR